MTTYWLIAAFGCIEPEIGGPYTTESARDDAAKIVRANQDDDDALFWLDITDGIPTTGAYSGGFFEPPGDG